MARGQQDHPTGRTLGLRSHELPRREDRLGFWGKFVGKCGKPMIFFTISSQVISQRSLKSLGRFRNLPMRYLPPKSMSGVLMHLIFWTGLAVLDCWKNCVVGTVLWHPKMTQRSSWWANGILGILGILVVSIWYLIPTEILSYLNYPIAL